MGARLADYVHVDDVNALASATVPKIICMSGYAEERSASEDTTPGLPFVQKPFTAAEFRRHVRDALDRPA